MITNIPFYNKFRKELIKKERFSYQQAVQIFEDLLSEAISVGCINNDTIWDGLETDIHIAQTLNRIPA